MEIVMGSRTGTRARVLANCGRALQAAGFWQLAGSAYKVALGRDNRPADWRYRLGLSLEHQDLLAEAASEYEFETFAVKPSTTYWLWVAAEDGATGQPIGYDATLCGEVWSP